MAKTNKINPLDIKLLDKNPRELIYKYKIYVKVLSLHKKIFLTFKYKTQILFYKSKV